MTSTLTDYKQLEYRGETPTRDFRKGAPTEGEIVCTRVDGTALDSQGEPGCTVVELVVGNRRRLLPRPIIRHSPTGFEWGYHGSGPADLAANCLAVVLPLKEAWRLHQRYKAWAVAGLPEEGGTLSIRAMRLWLGIQWAEELRDTLVQDGAEQRKQVEQVEQP